MIVSGTEKDILMTIGKSGKASKNEISRAVGFTIDYIELICNYLIRKGCLVRVKRHYMLTEDGERTLCSFEGKYHSIDKELIGNISSQMAKQLAKEVVAEIREKGISKEVITKTSNIYPEKKRFYSKREKDYPEKKQEIQIKTDFNLAVEDESLALESNIDKIGIKSEKEKSSIDKVIGLLKNIRKKVYEKS